MLKTSQDRIDLWLAFPDEIRDSQLLCQYRQLLTVKEQNQEQRFHFNKDRHRYLITRALVRTVLSKYAPVAPEQWSFSANSYGKPDITNDDSLARSISFNISHTDNLIILGITHEKPLGVDTENLSVRPAPVDVASAFFSAEEVAALYALPKDQQHDRFFQYWTFKESYIKARGMGLSLPLDQFSFDLRHDAQASISFHALIKDQPSRWRLWQYRVSSDYLMAVCAERIEGIQQYLNIKKIAPLAKEELFGCTLIRESA